MDLIKADEQIGEHVEFVTPEQFTWLLLKSLEPTNTENLATKNKSTLNAWVNTSGQLEVHLETGNPENFTISILDASGKLLLQENKTFSQENTQIVLSLPRLSSGLYILNVTGNRESLSRKIIF